jgi:fructose-specific phosphotransferase system IIC component
MIPTLLVVGAIAGMLPKGWLVLPLAALGWPLVLWLTGVNESAAGFAFASALGVANTAAGFALGLWFKFLANRTTDRLAR